MIVSVCDIELTTNTLCSCEFANEDLNTQLYTNNQLHRPGTC